VQVPENTGPVLQTLRKEATRCRVSASFRRKQLYVTYLWESVLPYLDEPAGRGRADPTINGPTARTKGPGLRGLAGPCWLGGVGSEGCRHPTHLRRMTSRRTREMRAGYRAKSPLGATRDPEEWARVTTTGVREWLASLSAVTRGRRAAPFDTRLRYLPVAGAAPLIARCPRHRGYQVDAPGAVTMGGPAAPQPAPTKRRRGLAKSTP